MGNIAYIYSKLGFFPTNSFAEISPEDMFLIVRKRSSANSRIRADPLKGVNNLKNIAYTKKNLLHDEPIYKGNP